MAISCQLVAVSATWSKVDFVNTVSEFQSTISYSTTKVPYAVVDIDEFRDHS